MCSNNFYRDTPLLKTILNTITLTLITENYVHIIYYNTVC